MPRKLRVALITEPTGNHLSSVIDALSNDEIGEVALGDETGETFDQIQSSAGEIVKNDVYGFGEALYGICARRGIRHARVLAHAGGDHAGVGSRRARVS